jgi:parallel beta-helix repeat protein
MFGAPAKVIGALKVSSCNVGGPIAQDTIWSPTKCDPYIVVASVLVNSGVTLTIAPGTRVKFNSGLALSVSGTLTAQGTSDSPITFTSNQPAPAPGDWGYIYLSPTSGNSILQYALVQYAGGANLIGNGAVQVKGSSPTIDHNTIRNNKSEGVYVSDNDTPAITNNTVSNNGIQYQTFVTGIVVDTSGPINITGNTVSANTEDGITVGNSATTIISGNTVSGNAFSGIEVYNSATTIISGNTVSNNQRTGIYAYNGTPTISNNSVIGNRGGGITAQDSTATISSNTIIGNTSYEGGGVYICCYGTATVISNTILSNTASSSGGGMSVNSAATIASNMIKGNTATNAGGGIELTGYGNTAKISGNNITLNTAGQANQGGGISICNGCNPTINNNNLMGDKASTPNEVYNGNAVYQPNVDATNNYWGTTKSVAIAARIWDFFDDSSLGIVTYSPFFTKTVGNTLANPGFELGPGIGWSEFSSGKREIITNELPHTGTYSAHECGYDSCTEYVQQAIYVPDGATVSYWWYMDSSDDPNVAHDFLKVEAYSTGGKLLRTVRTWDNTSQRDTWVQDTLGPSPVGAGKTVYRRFTTTTDSALPTSFYIDDVSVR